MGLHMENDAQNNNVPNDDARNNNMNEKEKMKRYGETKMKAFENRRRMQRIQSPGDKCKDKCAQECNWTLPAIFAYGYCVGLFIWKIVRQNHEISLPLDFPIKMFSHGDHLARRVTSIENLVVMKM